MANYSRRNTNYKSGYKRYDTKQTAAAVSAAQTAQTAPKTRTLQELIARRKVLWDKHHDLALDRRYVDAVADEITANRKNNLENRKLLYEKPYLLIELCMIVVDKDKNTVPFFLNDVQRHFIAEFERNNNEKPIFILKGRKQGFTTLITAIQLSYAIIRKNFSGFTLADTDRNAKDIFRDKAKVVFDSLPVKFRPKVKYDSSREYFFENLNSGWEVAPATENIGRSRTPIFLHMSEAAFYRSLAGLEKGMLEAMPKGATIIYESTANGYNDAKALWDKKTCLNLFYEWWQTSEYVENNTHIIGDVVDEWLQARVKWLRAKGLADNQIAWYVKKYNSYIDKNTIKQEYPCTAHEAFVSTGNCVFDKEQIAARLNSLKPPVKIGYFEYDYDGLRITNSHFVDDKNGVIKIYKDVAERRPYVIGADTAGEGSDYFVGQILDNTTGEQVAIMRQQVDEDLFVRQMYCLGMYYNEALVGIENNFSSYPTKELARIGYPNQYVREREDTYAASMTKSFGFKTTAITRPVIIAGLISVVRETPELINDETTLTEMQTFVKNPVGRAEAQEGANDDTIMALAIAYYIRPQQTFAERGREYLFRNWTPRQLEDYENADDETRAHLRRIWGNPA